jgi:hypothetical protein
MISNSEFLAHPEIYFDLARQQDVRIQNGGEIFNLIREMSVDERDNELSEDEVWRGMYNYLNALHPDGPPAILSDEEELARAITAEELLSLSRSLHLQ